MVAFTATWYWWTIITYGTNVPAGLFLPGMIIGCGVGDMAWRGLIHRYHFGIDCEGYGIWSDPNGLKDCYYGPERNLMNTYRRKYIILGFGSVMAGYTRMTYALGVILMETS